ncbi:hypothetical protein DPMN_046269 [Dreissena polymorpha]|uniref:Uncharacterized protein n=1 Tax=Dreissena polymorpha TaxID=45954 RepID=A0A9D4HY24_DREPO|nr:hypothetical protein DPMN_046269 [Dreissena polymorpha]
MPAGIIRLLKIRRNLTSVYDTFVAGDIYTSVCDTFVASGIRWKRVGQLCGKRHPMVRL